MIAVWLCIGNGLHANGKPSAISKQIVKEALDNLAARAISMYPPINKTGEVIFSGGYETAGITEAESMASFACRLRPDLSGLFVKTNPRRTHNSAVCDLETVYKHFGETNVMIYVFDHPLHIKRMVFTLQVVNRICHGNRYTIIPWPIAEVYDSEIPGQIYRISRRDFARREKWMRILYNIFLFRPWAKTGLHLLMKVWPS